MTHRLLASLAIPLLMSACTTMTRTEAPALAPALASQASAGPLAVSSGEVLAHNDAAFEAKLRIIENATGSVDLAYYIFAGDYTSSRLSQALIDAAARGVRVRLLLDYFSAYKDLDRLSWLEQRGGGNIAIRLYNRPTPEIVRDAAFLTLSCADVGARGGDCDDAKLAEVARHFPDAAGAGSDTVDRTLAGSGLFLSGLYGKNAKVMAYAVTRGQAIDTEALAAGAPAAGSDQTAQLKRLGKLYFKARYKRGAENLGARIKLAFVRLAFAEQVNPVFDALSSYLPLSRQNNAQARKDWDYLTEFLHHKFLLADRSELMLGGRNVEDSYHMRPNPLADKYIFMDTDIRLRLRGPDATLANTFDRLWQLGMVASLDQVRGHAPNDLLANFDVVEAAQQACEGKSDAACFDRYLDRHLVPLDGRMQAVEEAHVARIRRYTDEYRRIASAPLVVDPGAQIHYLENLPVAAGVRSYGAEHGREAASNTNIQASWRAALRGVCAAEGAAPRDVIIHNAYLFLPANLLQDLAASLDGSRRCPDVTLTLISNSLATTDLNVVNLLAMWQLKALADHLAERSASADAATLRYFEYQPVEGTRLSLHSKVMVFDEDIFIGSANADVRSLMMDSNNGLFIRNAPQLVADYKQWIGKLLASPARVADLTATLGRDAAQLRTDMNRLIDQSLARYAGPDRLSEQQQRDLKLQIEATSRRVYDLSRQIMRGSASAADEFNALFKTI